MTSYDLKCFLHILPLLLEVGVTGGKEVPDLGASTFCLGASWVREVFGSLFLGLSFSSDFLFVSLLPLAPKFKYLPGYQVDKQV